MNEHNIAWLLIFGGTILHFLAIAHAADVEWTIDDFERASLGSNWTIRFPVPDNGGVYLVPAFAEIGRAHV